PNTTWLSGSPLTPALSLQGRGSTVLLDALNVPVRACSSPTCPYLECLLCCVPNLCLITFQRQAARPRFCLSLLTSSPSFWASFPRLRIGCSIWFSSAAPGRSASGPW